MNLFDNIIQSQFNKFTGNSQPTTPSFSTPIAPRTVNYNSQVNTPTPQVNTQPTPTGGLFGANFGANPTPSPRAKVAMSFGLNEKEMGLLDFAKSKGIDANTAMSYVQDKRKQEQAQVEKARQGEGLGIIGNIKEGAIGAFRAGEQIPRIAGAGMDYLTQNVTGPLVAGGLDLVGAEDLANRWRSASKTVGELYRNIGEDITMAGMTNGGTKQLTQKQIDARKFGGELALTAPIGGEYLAGSKGLLGLAGRSGIVGAGFGATQPIIEKGGEATMGDIATGAGTGFVGGAVAGPIIGKVIAPAIGGIASKTGKYGTALIKGGVEGAKKSIARDISAIKTPGVETITRNIPKAVVRRDLGFTPTERAKIEKITGQDEGTYILSKGLAGKGKEELAEVFMKQSDDMYNGITKNLSNVDAKVQSPVAKEALLDIMEQLESSPKIARAYAKDLEGVKAMLARDEFTLSELNNIRRAYDKVNTGMFTVQGKARSGLENAIDVKVRQDLSNQLQNEAKKYGVDVKAMNTELRAGLEMKDALLRRLSQEERNNFIGLQDLGVSAILSGGEPVSAVATIAAKKYAEKVAPGLAQKAFNLNKAPNVTRNVSRGNTITPRNKSSQLGLASNPSTPVVSNVVKQIKKPIVKPNTIKNESKVNKPISSDTIPEGYIENPMTGEIIKKPSWKKGGFIKIPEIGKKVEPLIEEAKKYKSAEEFIKDNIEFERGGEIRVSNGEAGKGIYMFPRGSKGFKEYYVSDKNPLVYSSLKKGSKIEDLIKRQQDVKDYLNYYFNEKSFEMGKGYIKPKITNDNWWTFGDGIESYIKERGLNIDGYIVPHKGYGLPTGKQVIIKNEKALNTISDKELKQIYNQSKSIVKNPLVEEARKYKSAEEFVKNNSLKSNRITSSDDAYQKGGYDGVLNIVEDADNINLTLIELKEKGTGKGTEIVKELKEYADANNKKLKIINSSNDKYWNAFKFFEKDSFGRYVYKPNSKPFTVGGRRGLDYDTPKKMVGKEVSYNGKNYEITGYIYSDESGTLYYKIKGSDGNKIVTPDKLSEKIEGIVQKDKEITQEIIKQKRILGKKISKEDEQHLFKKNNTRK